MAHTHASVRKAWKQELVHDATTVEVHGNHRLDSVVWGPSGVLHQSEKMTTTCAAVHQRAPPGSLTLTMTPRDLSGRWGSILLFTGVEMEALAHGFTDPELEPIQQSAQVPTEAGATVGPEPGGSAASRGPLSYFSQIRLSTSWVQGWVHGGGHQLVHACPGFSGLGIDNPCPGHPGVVGHTLVAKTHWLQNGAYSLPEHPRAPSVEPLSAPALHPIPAAPLPRRPPHTGGGGARKRAGCG